MAESRSLSKRQDQKHAFIPAAKAAETDTDESRWEARLKTVAKPSKPAKKGK